MYNAKDKSDQKKKYTLIHLQLWNLNLYKDTIPTWLYWITLIKKNTNLSVFRKIYLYLPVVSALELKSWWRPSRPDYPSDRLRVPDNLWPPRIWRTPRGSPRPHCGEGTSDPVSDHQSPGCSFRKPSHSRSENILFPETPQMKISPVTINHSVSVPNEEKPEKGGKKLTLGKWNGYILVWKSVFTCCSWPYWICWLV